MTAAAVRQGPEERARRRGSSYGHKATGGRAEHSGGPDGERIRTKERELVSRASRGDVEAFSKPVRQHSGRVRGVTRRMLGGREAEDAAQEVWIRAWANVKNFKGESAFGTWLYRIATNVCLDARRQAARRQGREAGEGALPHLSEPTGGDGDAETAALDSERREEVWRVLSGVRA